MKLNYVKTPVRFGMIHLTPDVAMELIASMAPNRREKKSVIERYAKTFSTTKNLTIYQPIILNHKGEMIDGQHRCHAVIASKTAIHVCVLDGVPGDAWVGLDEGTKRSFSDVLSTDGNKNSALLAAIITLTEKYRKGDFSGVAAHLDHQHGLAMLSKYPKFKDAADSFSGHKGLFKILTPSVCGFLRFHTSHYYEQVEQFFNQIETGVGITREDQPAAVLRNRLLLEHRGITKLQLKVKLGLCIKAVNGHILGDRIGVLRYRPSEDMPKLVAEWGNPIDGRALEDVTTPRRKASAQ